MDWGTVSRRAWLSSLAAIAAGAFAVLLKRAWRRFGPLAVDNSVQDRFPGWLTARDARHWVEYFGYPGGPLAVVLGSLVLAALVWQRARHVEPAIFAAIVPITVSMFAELVLKTLVDRQAPRGGGSFFPSGHVVGVTSVALAAWLVWVSCWPSRIARAFGAGALAVLVLAVATSQVATRQHYVTDAVGGALYAVAAVAAIAAVFVPEKQCERAKTL
jgi:membrane-associated phospholipid phosphatase